MRLTEARQGVVLKVMEAAYWAVRLGERRS